MRTAAWLRTAAAFALCIGLLAAQLREPIPPFPVRPAPPQPAAPQQQPQTNPPRQNPPAAQQPTSPAGTPAQPATAPGQPAAQNPATPAPSGPPTIYGGLTLNNASLTEVIDMLARQLHMNYILDPRVKGGVILNTYGETKNIDTRSLLEAILRINGFGMVKQGDLYRIVPLADISHLPLPPETITDPKEIPEDDRTMLDLVFLKFVTADELMKVLEPFIGENARMYSYSPANLLFILDSRRNMRRTLELISLFDNDQLANQRVRLFTIEHTRPSDLAKEVEGIVKSISLNDKTAPIKFLPIDRINTIIAVAPNPGAFTEVEKWIKKLDIPVKASVGGIENYVYRVRYGNAAALACGITMLYGGGGFSPACMMAAMSAMGGMGGGTGPGLMGGGGMYGGMMGGMMGGMGMYPGAMGGGMGYGMGMYPGMTPGYGMNTGYGAYGAPAPGVSPFGPIAGATAAQPSAGAATSGQPGQADLTGSYLGYQAVPGYAPPRVPRIIPNPFNNTLMIQGTPQEYEGILNLLRDMDLPPRQVLIDAKIYEIDLTGAFSSGVAAALQDKTVSSGSGAHHFTANLNGALTNMTDGFLVGRTKELLAAVQLAETQTKAKVISAPSVIATDSIAASINVGTEVPTLTAQAVTGAQQNGNSLFANTISNRNTGVTLSITAQVNPSGIVTMIINQEVSAPQPPPAGGIQSPSFSKRAVQTQVTVQDGDTIAVGGIINEANTFSTAGIPVLHRLPVIGAAFGSRSYNKQRTEMIIFMTPHVIYDTNMIVDASEELKSRLHTLSKIVKE